MKYGGLLPVRSACSRGRSAHYLAGRRLGHTHVDCVVFKGVVIEKGLRQDYVCQGGENHHFDRGQERDDKSWPGFGAHARPRASCRTNWVHKGKRTMTTVTQE